MSGVGESWASLLPRGWTRVGVGGVRAAAKHPALTPYNRLVVTVLLVNGFVLARQLRTGAWSIDDGTLLAAVADLAVGNLGLAVVVRNQWLLDLLYRSVGRGSPSWPLPLRWAVAKVNHVGGVHAGAASAGSAWVVVLAVSAFATRARAPAVVTATTTVLCGVLAGLLVVVTLCALPGVRRRFHDLFEHSHRWGGWSALAVFWALTIHRAAHGADGSPVAALAAEWSTWVLLVATASVVAPWLRLRRVPITVERPSSHVAIVQIDGDVQPRRVTAVGISRHPLRQWHTFATIASPDRTGFRLVISRAGDWTGAFIDDPPTHVWLRGMPVSAVMATATLLFRRVVYVATGSGIGPLLGQILAAPVPSQLVWSTRNPRRTYGDELVDEIERAQPHAVVFDTTSDGDPDMLDLVLDAHRDLDAEAVMVVSNREVTLDLVHQLERRGIPAFGPIWDS